MPVGPRILTGDRKPGAGQLGRALWLAIVSLVAGSCDSGASNTAASPPASPPILEARTTIRLNFHLESEVTTTFVSVGDDRSLQSVRYNQYRRVIDSLREGTVPEREAAPLLETAGDPRFRRLLREADQTHSDVSYEGDFFTLSVESAGSAAAHCVATLEYVPAAVRSFVQKILDLSLRVPVQPLAPAYVRVGAFSDEQRRSLEKAGRTRVVALDDVPQGSRARVARIISRPGRFHSLTRSRYEELLPLSSQGTTAFVRSDGAVYALALFTSKEKAGDQRKEEGP